MQRPVTLWGERQKVWDLEVLKKRRGEGMMVVREERARRRGEALLRDLAGEICWGLGNGQRWDLLDFEGAEIVAYVLPDDFVGRHGGRLVGVTRRLSFFS